MDKQEFAENINRTYEKMTAEEKQNSQERIAKRLSQITDPEEEKKRLNKKKAKAIFKKSLFSSPLKRLVLLRDYSGPDDITDNETSEKYQVLKDRASDFVKDIADDKASYNMVFMGRPGAGKTYLSISLLGQLLVERKSVLFINTTKLKDMAFDFRNPVSMKRIESIKKYAAECDLLILDDMGTETSNRMDKRNEAAETIQQLIYNFADARIGKPTLITTNLSKDELEQIYNEKITSRLLPKNPKRVVNFNQLSDLRGRG